MVRTMVIASAFVIYLLVGLLQYPHLAQATSSDAQPAIQPPLTPTTDTAQRTHGAVSAQLTKKASSGVVTVGDIVTYTMRLTNTTGGVLQNLVLFDRLPTGLTSAGATYSGSGMTDPIITLMGDGVRFIAGALSPGGNIELVLPAQLDLGLSNGMVVTNTVLFTGTTTSGPLYQKATAPIMINNPNPIADFMVQKLASSTSVAAGAPLTYTIFITNVGSTAIQNLVLSEPLPTGYGFVGTRLAGTDAEHAELTASTSRLTVTMPSLAVNGNLILIIKGFTASNLALNTVIVNRVTATASNDMNATNNQSTVNVTISKAMPTATPTQTPTRTPTPTITRTPTVTPTNTPGTPGANTPTPTFVATAPTTPSPTPTAREALDSDYDGILDSIECGVTATCADRDNDGKANAFDIDSDGDGIPDRMEAITGQQQARSSQTTPMDTDGDDAPDYLDVDSDNDGVADAIEAYDSNNDRRTDTVVTGKDRDVDGLDDAFDTVEAVGFSDENALGANTPLPDFDNDGVPNWRDTDDDGDGILTALERSSTQLDIDGDGFPNDLDLDADGDGVPDAQEVGSNPAVPLDLDRNGVADYLENIVTVRQLYLPLVTKTQ